MLPKRFMDLCYLFCNAQCAKAVGSIQVQVILGPVDNLFLALPFGVTLKTIKGQKIQD